MTDQPKGAADRRHQELELHRVVGVPWHATTSEGWQMRDSVLR